MKGTLRDALAKARHSLMSHQADPECLCLAVAASYLDTPAGRALAEVHEWAESMRARGCIVRDGDEDQMCIVHQAEVPDGEVRCEGAQALDRLEEVAR